MALKALGRDLPYLVFTFSDSRHNFTDSVFYKGVANHAETLSLFGEFLNGSQGNSKWQCVSSNSKHLYDANTATTGAFEQIKRGIRKSRSNSDTVWSYVTINDASTYVYSDCCDSTSWRVLVSFLMSSRICMNFSRTSGAIA